jgi:hypothetical protein|tara:strand:- start:932 stop:1336 length:405 start_codon:yes stop_codon:yes gene_type:complete
MIPLITTLLPSIMDVAGRFLPEDKQKRAEAEREIEAKLTESLANIDLANLKINEADAKSGNWFQSGWRPFIGWSCGFALAYTYVMQPILTFGLAQAGYLIDLPAVNLGEMMPVLMGLLGLGGLRTFEKVKGISK